MAEECAAPKTGEAKNKYKNRCKDIAHTFSYTTDRNYVTLEMKLTVA
jgi:hypothetical protein